MKYFGRIIALISIGLLMANCAGQGTDGSVVESNLAINQEVDIESVEDQSFNTASGNPANFQQNPRVESVSLGVASNGKALLKFSIFKGLDGEAQAGRKVSIFKESTHIWTGNGGGCLNSAATTCNVQLYLERFMPGTRFKVSVTAYDKNGDFSRRSANVAAVVPDLSQKKVPTIKYFKIRSGSTNYLRYTQGSVGGDVTRSYRVYVNGVHKGSWTSGGRDFTRGYHMPKSYLPDDRKNVITIKSGIHGIWLTSPNQACTYGKDDEIGC